MQEASEFSYDYRAFIFEFKVQSCILSQFQELGTGGLVRKKKADLFMKIFNIQNVCEKITFLNCKFKMFKKLPNTIFKKICMFFYREALIFLPEN